MSDGEGVDARGNREGPRPPLVEGAAHPAANDRPTNSEGQEDDEKEAGNGVLASQTAQCPLCRWPIDPGAKYCLKCKTYRGWRKIFGLGVVVPSLVLGIMSVASVLVPRIHGLLTHYRSETAFVVYAVSKKTVTLIVTNKGLRAGFIQSASLTVLSKGKPAREGARLLVWANASSDNKDGLVVEPGQWRTIKLGFPDKAGLPENDDDDAAGTTGLSASSCKYQIVLNILNFDLTADTRTQTTDCRKPEEI